jgi:DNA polymerase III subunit gamma/tau
VPESTDDSLTAAADRRVLYLRWRPSTFADVVGQEHAVRTLKNAAASGRLAHAYLFSGPRGTGKTSIARILFKAANCLNAVDGEPCDRCGLCRAANEGRSLDLIELDAASNRGIDDIRDLRDRVHFSPVEGRYRVYIVDEAHELTRDAWDAFLKTLEEPPPHVIFVLATTESHRVPPTIASRCQRFDFRRLALESVVNRLRAIADSESLDVDESVYEALARLAQGGMRDAISLLDQLRAYCGTAINEEDARTVLGLPPAGTARNLLAALARDDLAEALRLLDDSVGLGVDMRLLMDELLDHARGLLLTGFRATSVLEHEMGSDTVQWLQDEIGAWRRQQLLALTRGLADALLQIKETHRLRLAVELLFAEIVVSRADSLTDPEPSTPAPEEAATPRKSAPAPAAKAAPASAQTSKPAPANMAASKSTSIPRAEAALGPTPRMPSAATGESGVDAPQPATAAPGPAPSSSRAADPPATPSPQQTGSAREDEIGDDSLPEPPVAEPLTLDRVRGSWRAVVDSVHSQNGPLGAVLDAAQPMTVEGSTITLGVPYAFHVKLILDQTKRRTIEDVWSRVIGANVRVDCRAAQEEQRPHPSAVTSDDPVVRAALEIFGGEATVVTDDGRPTTDD